ncbi:MAG: hypothetical protein LUD17_02025 [Bacteroidales bacterium]|nr:hypothetical protein [Bacteroidales bacterium]
MKRIFLAMAIALGVAMGVLAQTRSLNPENAPYWGLRAGVGGTAFIENSDEKLFQGKFSTDLRVIRNYTTADNGHWYIEPAISLYYNTWSWDVGVLAETASYIPLSNSFRNFGVGAQVSFGFRAFIKERQSFHVSMGLEPRVGLVCNCHVKYSGASVSGSEYGSDGICNRFDLATVFDIGFNIDNFYVGMHATGGMLNLIKDGGGYTVNLDTVLFSIGYNFSVK